MLQNQSSIGFNGYYSLYIGLVFYSTGNQSDISATELNKLTDVHFQIGGNTIIPKINISSTYNNDWLPVNSSYYYVKTVWLKYDFYFDANENNTWPVINSFNNSANSIQLTKTNYDEYWICSLINFSVVKYKDQSQFDNSESLDSIAQNIAQLNTNFSQYVPQIVSYLMHIDANTDSLEYYILNTNDYLDLIYSDFEYFLDSLVSGQSDIYDLLRTALTSNTRTTIYWMLYQLTISLTSQGLSSSNSLFYKLFQDRLYYNFLYFDPDYLDESEINYQSQLGVLYTINKILESINNALLYDWQDKQNIINSQGYQAGEAIAGDIDSAGGFNSLTGVGSDLSGFGNMVLIPSIFNGIGSAFRWFSTETRDNLDMVRQTRIPQETISHFYEDNQALAESFLAGDNDD